MFERMLEYHLQAKDEYKLKDQEMGMSLMMQRTNHNLFQLHGLCTCRSTKSICMLIVR